MQGTVRVGYTSSFHYGDGAQCTQWSNCNESLFRKHATDWKRPQANPITHGSEPLSLMWNRWTVVLHTHGTQRRHPFKINGVRLWTRLLSRSVCVKTDISPVQLLKWKLARQSWPVSFSTPNFTLMCATSTVTHTILKRKFNLWLCQIQAIAQLAMLSLIRTISVKSTQQQQH